MSSTHAYWGSVKADWAGFSAARTFFIPGFEKESEVFLGEEFDEDGEEVETLPTAEKLNAFATTFRQLLEGWDAALASIKDAAFERYQRLYAHYYEDAASSGEPPLGITNANKHFAYMKDLNYLRVLDDDAVRLVIFYEAIDPEHGLEIKLVNGAVQDIGGIAET